MSMPSPATPRRNQFHAFLALFGSLYCVLHVGTIFLKTTTHSGLTVGDWVSLLIPWGVVGAAALVYIALPTSTAAVAHPHQHLGALFLASGLLYATGYGVNLAANAIGRLLYPLGPSPAAQLAYLLDEHLGHVLWHLGLIGLTVAILARSPPAADGVLTPITWLGVGGFAFAYFTDAVEGQTVPLLFPAALLIWLGLHVAHRPVRWAPRRDSAALFFRRAYGLALILFLIWRIWQGGFPQFSEVWGL